MKTCEGKRLWEQKKKPTELMLAEALGRGMKGSVYFMNSAQAAHCTSLEMCVTYYNYGATHLEHHMINKLHSTRPTHGTHHGRHFLHKILWDGPAD